MKRILLTLFTVTALSFPLYASLLHVGVNAGYAYASMEDLNNSWEDAKEAAKNDGRDATISSFGHAIFVNADLDIGLVPIISFGPRVGFQYVLPVTYEESVYIDPVTATVKEEFNAMLVPVLFGAAANIGLPGMPFSLTAAIYGGYGFGFASRGVELPSGTPYLTKYSTLYQGGGFMADAAAAVEFAVLPFITLSVNLGYRWADISEMKAVDKIDIPGVITVDAGELPKIGDKPVSYNFSGINAGLGLNIRF